MRSGIDGLGFSGPKLGNTKIDRPAGRWITLEDQLGAGDNRLRSSRVGIHAWQRSLRYCSDEQSEAKYCAGANCMRESV